MKQLYLAQAYTIVSKLAGFQLPPKKALALYKMTKVLNEAYSFIEAEEKKLLATHEYEIAEDGNLKFKDEETIKSFLEKRNELYNLESETEIVPVVITAEDLGEQTISLNDIVGLEGIVDFE